MNVIAHNLMAMNTQRMLRTNQKKSSASSVKLSTGYKLNIAADDAAGLCISEKMRQQIRGLEKGSGNIQDGISLVQVADGALADVHSMLHRMNELAVQAANDTNTKKDRQALQHELEALTTEINRIGKDTTFNTMHIFDDLYGTNDINVGDVTKMISCPSANLGYMAEAHQVNGKWFPASTLDFSNINESNIEKLHEKGFSFSCSRGCEEIFDFKFATDATPSSASNLSGKVHHYYTVNISNCKNGKEIIDTLFAFVQANPPVNNTGGEINNNIEPGDLAVSHSNNMARSPDGTKLTIYANTKVASVGNYLTSGYATEEEARNAYPLDGYPYQNAGEVDCSVITALRDFSNIKNEFNIQCSSNEKNRQMIRTNMMNADILGVNDLYLTTNKSANIAIDLIAAAVNTVSTQRSELGAYQNRLEYSYNNVTNEMENVQSSESRIRDTDMAEEMIEYSKHNILLQSGQAMLVQANQNTANILNLIQ